MQEFLYSIKSEKTKSMYEYCISCFTRFAKMEIQDLLDLPKEKIQKIIIDYIIYMRDSKLSYSSIRTRVSPLFTFLELNDIFVNKLKIQKFFGEQNKITLRLTELEIIRNAIAHTRTLSDEGMKRLEQYAQDIINLT